MFVTSFYLNCPPLCNQTLVTQAEDIILSCCCSISGALNNSFYLSRTLHSLLYFGMHQATCLPVNLQIMTLLLFLEKITHMCSFPNPFSSKVFLKYICSNIDKNQFKTEKARAHGKIILLGLFATYPPSSTSLLPSPPPATSLRYSLTYY